METVFHYLSRNEWLLLCGYLDKKQWKKGDTVMREGEQANSMAFIISGSLSVKKETVFPGRYTIVALLERGAMVGEVSVMEKTDRTATVVAAEDCSLFELSSENFEKLLDREPVLGVKILRRILHVVGLRIKQADDRLAHLL
jgi:CRP-like cAMP-binding protein